jgi:cytosine permease
MLSQTASRDDFARSPVPLASRRPWWNIFSVWVGFIIVVGIMAIGGGLAAGMSLASLLWAVVLGNLILGSLAALSGYVGAQSGKSFAQLCTDVFPGVSGNIVCLYAPVTLVTWYSIECAIFGSLMGHILGLGPLMSKLAMAASAAVFCITTYIGFQGLRWLSLILVPTTVVLGTYAFLHVVSTGSGHFGFGPGQISFNDGLGLVIGSWALGVVAAYPDLARFARSPAAAAWMGLFGILIFNSLNFLIGAAGAALSRQYDPALILLAAGVPVLAVVMGIGNVWTTNDANLYSASLGISRALPIGRRPAVLICAGLSVLIAFSNPAQFSVFFRFLGLMGTTAPALGGAVLGGYFLNRSGQMSTSSLPAWLGWLAGSTTSYLTGGVVSVPAGFVGGFLIFWLARVVIGGRGTRGAQPR